MKNKWITFPLCLMTMVTSLNLHANDLSGLEAYSQESGIEIAENDRIEMADVEKERLFKNGNYWKKLKDFENLAKEDKVLVVNIAVISLITVHGFFNWEYGKSSLKFKDEGWFGDDTKSGGADKLGHFYSTYAMSDILAYYYRKWDYEKKEAAKLAAISAWILQGLMEVGDSSSPSHGFSKEDLIANTLGSLASYYLQTNEELDALIDLRVEYENNVEMGDIFTDYENMTYLMAIKGSGIKGLNNTLLQYFELHVGYFARGFHRTSKEESKSRNLYVGVGLNVPLVLKKNGYNRASAVAEYIQLPFTSTKVGTVDLND